MALSCSVGFGIATWALSPPPRSEGQRFPETADYQERLARTKALGDYMVKPAVAQRAVTKIARAEMETQGVRLFQAYPYTKQPELVSTGSPKTLTILIDFSDCRAAVTLPGFTTNSIHQMMYGSGTAAAQNYFPFESVRNYYWRASQELLGIRGNVLGWYSFPKKQDDYKPKIPANASEDDRHRLENQAIYDMAAEALRYYDASHDFSQYDNDRDGDIDLVNIIYAGTNGGWGSFWWAYQSQFFTPSAYTDRFDGKRLKQFIFSFVSVRGDEKDFDPVTIIHETGHALGLPDYYDYNVKIGPPGGVGGLDIMDGLVGNHCAFSRWLLDWIKPVVIGSPPPTSQTLIAAGLAAKTNEAVAVFPQLNSAGAPSGELFIVENRHRVGNDGGVSDNPGEGVLIWHVDASPNRNNDAFQYDNSYTAPKLLRLMRADNPQDFGKGQWANSDTYFNDKATFNSASQPSSADNNGKPTGVTVEKISPAKDTMTAMIGIEPGANPIFRANVITNQIDLRQPFRFFEHLDSPKPSPGPDKREAALPLASPEELRSIWRTNRINPDVATNEPPALMYWENVLTTWASKDGRSAVSAVLEIPEGKFKWKMYPLVLEAWAWNDPPQAYDWYVNPENASLRKSPTLVAGPQFFRTLFEWKAINGIDSALSSIPALHKVNEMEGAYRGLRDAAERYGITEETLFHRAKIKSVDLTVPKAITHAKDLLYSVDNEVSDPAMQQTLKKLLNEATTLDVK